MDKKFKFSDQPITAKITYSVVVAILAISAIVVGMVSVGQANKQKTPTDDEKPPVTDQNPSDTDGDGEGDGTGGENQQPDTPSPTIYYSPVTSGSIMKGHSTEVPVFSQTLSDWRVHTGIDIAAELGTDVLAVAGGTVTQVKNDHFFGKTVEITHDGGIVSVYSNLSNDGITVQVGDTVKAGDKLGVVGDTSLTELADESHIHFEIMVSGVSVNPLDYIDPDSQKNSLGVK